MTEPTRDSVWLESISRARFISIQRSSQLSVLWYCTQTESLEATDVKTFRKAIPAVVSIYKRHISIEDELVFPLAARLLSSTEKAAIADEMAARRKVRLVVSI